MELSEYDEVEAPQEINVTYSKLDEIDHVLVRPTMYLGSTNASSSEEFCFDFETGEAKQKNVRYSYAIVHAYNEILTNAGDNVDRSRRSGFSPGTMEVRMDNKTIRVRNSGRPIPVEKQEDGIYIPQMIFGMLRSSSNYDETQVRMGGGTNGLGAKLVNIFSKTFQVTVGDAAFAKKKFVGVWTNNMRDAPDIKVEKYKGENYVEVSWEIDFDKVGIKEYSKDIIQMFAMIAVNYSLTCKVPIRFNGYKYDFSDPLEFCSLIWGPEVVEKAIVHHDWERGREPKGNKINWDQNIPKNELVLLDTPDSGYDMAFANGVYNKEGGTHVEGAYSDFAGKFIKKLKYPSDTVKLSVRDIKLHVSLLVNCRVPNPVFQGQMKTKLLEPKIRFDIPEKEVDIALKSWDLKQRIDAEINAKMYKKLKATEGKGRSMIFEKAHDATRAGTADAKNCTYILVEGLSASQYPLKRINHFKKFPGPRYNGIHPLRGKLLNVSKSTVKEITESTEIRTMVEMLGLKYGADYSIQEEIDTLRYGRIEIITDADDDGKHISCLILNFFNCFFPGIIKNGLIAILEIPVIKVQDKKGNVVGRFYSSAEYDKWNSSLSESERKKLEKPLYFKGLATSEDDDIKDDVDHAPRVRIVYDDMAPAVLDMAFGKDNADLRKLWIQEWRDKTDYEDIGLVKLSEIEWDRTVSSMISDGWVTYSTTNLIRSIPCVWDGLKEVQRKIIFQSLKEWKNCHRVDRGQQIMVYQLGGSVAKEMKYHHGDKSLNDTITRMCQDFVGSNNLPLLWSKTQVGTRFMGPKVTGQARYIKVQINPITHYIFPMDIISLMPPKIDEGNEVEPEWLPSIIPVVLCNGTSGIATGHSTFIPNHNPLDLIEWLQRRCSGVEDPEPVNPWYKNFRGKIEIKRSSNLNEYDFASEESVEEDDYVESKGVRNSMVVEGTFVSRLENQRTKNPRHVIEVTELPIGVWLNDYRKWLEKMKKEDKFIDDFDWEIDYDTQKIKITIKGWNMRDEEGKLRKVNLVNLGLKRSYGLSNMNLIDENGYPISYENVQDILHEYYNRMIQIFKYYKDQLLKEMKMKYEADENKAKFVNLIITGEVLLSDHNKPRPQREIVEDMKSHSVKDPEKLLTSVSVSQLTEELYNKLLKQVRDGKELHRQTSERTPESMWFDRLEELKGKI